MLFDTLQGRNKLSKNQDFIMTILFMVFLIVCTFIISLFSIYYKDYDDPGPSNHDCPGKAFIGILLFLVTTEFIIALTSVIFTCLFACCGASGCWENSQRGNAMYYI